MKQYSRVTYDERCQIFILLETKLSIPAIAKKLGRHKTTIYREVQRNVVKKSMYANPEYSFPESHWLAKKRFLKHCRRPLKVDGPLQAVVIEGLQRRWGPELIAGRIRREMKIPISHMTIYRFVKRNPFYKTCLLHKGKRYSKRSTPYFGGAKFFTIHDRPKDCNERTSLGHWERDLMFAKDRTPILVCTDRKSRFTVMERLESKSSTLTQEVTRDLILTTGIRLKSITNDNGTEFRSRKDIGRKIYFSDPGKPNQRGTVENTIGVIRRFIKNDTDISNIDLNTINSWMNHRPRKVLDYRTPYEVMYNKKVALVM